MKGPVRAQALADYLPVASCDIQTEAATTTSDQQFTKLGMQQRRAAWGLLLQRLKTKAYASVIITTQTSGPLSLKAVCSSLFLEHTPKIHIAHSPPPSGLCSNVIFSGDFPDLLSKHFYSPPYVTSSQSSLSYMLPNHLNLSNLYNTYLFIVFNENFPGQRFLFILFSVMCSDFRKVSNTQQPLNKQFWTN